MAKKKVQNKKTLSGIRFKELAALYDVSRHTFTKWIAPFRNKLGHINGRALTPKQIKIIFKHLDKPL